MTKLHRIPAAERGLLAPLFELHRRDRVFIDSVLEGLSGEAHADHPQSPAVARLDCGPFTMLGGDPTSSAVADLIAHRPIDCLTPETDAWQELLEETFAGRISRIGFTDNDLSQLDPDRLRGLLRPLPEGVELLRLEGELVDAFAELPEKAWIVSCFASAEDYSRRVLGFVARYEGRIVCSAVSAARSEHGIDIDIETDPEHRRKGLATITGAALVLECLIQGIEPHWLAENEISCRVAAKLGYTRMDSYDTFEIAAA